MLIGFLDADCFYVSAERVRHPDLIGKPVAVLGNNGACVIAKSYEMKALGVRTGEVIWDAVRSCPEGIYIKRDFRWYEVLSRAMLDIVKSYSSVVEYYSIDEFFFHYEGAAAEAEQVARTIRDRIRKEAGLPVTIGIARTRTLAKLFGETVKPFGAVAVLEPNRERELLQTLPVDAIAGINKGRTTRLRPFGVKTCWELAKMQRSVVRKALTITGERLWYELNGQKALPLQTQKIPIQTISRGGGISATADEIILRAWVTRHVERLIEELDFHEVCTSRITLYVQHRSGVTGFGEVNLESATDRFDHLLEAALDAFNYAWVQGEMANRIDLMATRLTTSRYVQLTLFDTGREQAIMTASLKRAINRKFGRFTLRSGATLPLYEMYQDGASGYDICDIKGKLCF